VENFVVVVVVVVVGVQFVALENGNKLSYRTFAVEDTSDSTF
jgi:hypothetical protein